MNATSRHALIAPDLDLVAADKGRGLGFLAWIDRRARLRFGLLPSLQRRPRLYIEDETNDPRETIVYVELEEVARANFPKDLVYRVSKSAMLAAARSAAGRRVAERLGGEQAFLDYCLKAARACHCGPRPVERSEPSSPAELVSYTTNSVEFVIVA